MTLILSMNCFWVRKAKVHQLWVTEPHVKFHERQEFTMHSLVYRIVYQNLKLKYLIKRCAQELIVANCVAPNSCTKSATVFPSIRCGLHIFTDELVWKLVDDNLNTWPGCLWLCFAFISNLVTNFSVGFCCVMFMSTVAVLDVFSAWVTIKHHTSI